MYAHGHPAPLNQIASLRSTKLVLWIGVAVLLLMVTSTAAFSQGITKTLDYPGASFTGPEDINHDGVVVGYQYKESDGISHGFFYQNGKFTSYDVPDSMGTQIRGINKYGDIVGAYTDSQSQSHGYVRDHMTGQVKVLDLFGVNQTYPSGINDQGTITGLYIDNNQVGHFFVYANGQKMVVDVPNATIPGDFSSWPKINNSGSIVGTVIDNDTGERRAALVSNSSWMLFNVNGQNSTGRAINASGAIAGYYAGGASGFVIRNGAITLIQIPGALATNPLGINDRQQVVGAYNDVNATHGFLMQVP